MESLPRRCELPRPARGEAATLWRLFGLVPRDRRRSGFSSACDKPRPRDNDLPPAASSQASPLRSEPRDDTSVITPLVTGEVKIRGDVAWTKGDVARFSCRWRATSPLVRRNGCLSRGIMSRGIKLRANQIYTINLLCASILLTLRRLRG